MKGVPMKSICFVCQNVDCLSRGSEPLMKELTEKAAARSLDVEVKPYICFGGCDHGPNIVLYPQKIWYAGVDRKSTRLNSSHVKISYAVFCLKKKKNYQ